MEPFRPQPQHELHHRVHHISRLFGTHWQGHSEPSQLCDLIQSWGSKRLAWELDWKICMTFQPVLTRGVARLSFSRRFTRELGWKQLLSFQSVLTRWNWILSSFFNLRSSFRSCFFRGVLHLVTPLWHPPGQNSNQKIPCHVPTQIISRLQWTSCVD